MAEASPPEVQSPTRSGQCGTPSSTRQSEIPALSTSPESKRTKRWKRREVRREQGTAEARSAGENYIAGFQGKEENLMSLSLRERALQGGVISPRPPPSYKRAVAERWPSLIHNWSELPECFGDSLIVDLHAEAQIDESLVRYLLKLSRAPERDRNVQLLEDFINQGNCAWQDATRPQEGAPSQQTPEPSEEESQSWADFRLWYDGNPEPYTTPRQPYVVLGPLKLWFALKPLVG